MKDLQGVVSISRQPTSNQLRVRTGQELIGLSMPLRADLLSPWLTQRHLSMVYAPTGVGKSWFVLSIALAVAGGGEVFGWTAKRPRKVLLVDGEMDVEDLKERAVDLLKHLQTDHEAVGHNLLVVAQQDQDISIKFPDLSTEEGQERIMEIAVKHNVELVILDNFSTLCEVDDENAASSFNPVLNFLRRLKQGRMAAILVHHSRKGGASAGSYRGTSKMAVVFNSIIALKHPDGIPSRGPAAFDIEFEKYRGLRDERVATHRARLEDKDGQRVWSVEKLADDEVAQLVALVKACDYATQGELAKAMDKSQGTVAKWKRKAVDSGLITDQEWDKCMKTAEEIRTAGLPENPDF